MSRKSYLNSSIRLLSAHLVFSLMGVQAAQESHIREGDRVVVVGDSITGQSAGANGYVGFLREALEMAHPGTQTTLFPLGGGGQTVGSWGSVEKDSREKHFQLDVPDVDAKTTLDGGADVLIIMLGMNNVLRPDTENSPESVANWTKLYRALIVALRERTRPRVIALATPTLCTEDEASLKNNLLDELSRAINELAESENCLVLPVRETYKKMLRVGRTYRPDFHLAGDYVHPGAEGHLAIAKGMLEGLGETAAAEALFEAHAPEMFRAIAGELPALSYTVERLSTTNGDEQAFKVRYWLTTEMPRAKETSANVELVGPEGWKVSPASHRGAEGEFTMTGSLDRLQNRFVLSARHEDLVRKSEIVIPAPWLVGVGSGNPTGWTNQDGWKFDPALGRLPADADLSRGLGFDHPLSPDAQWSRIPEWRYYVASLDYTGGNDAGSVDIAGSGAWGGTFDVAYGVRWINSPTDRTVPVTIGSDIFAGGYNLAIWLNGSSVWDSEERSGETAIRLKKGWNVLVFKSNHLEWQWQFYIRLLATPEDDLNDLQFSVVPHEVSHLIP